MAYWRVQKEEREASNVGIMISKIKIENNVQVGKFYIDVITCNIFYALSIKK